MREAQVGRLLMTIAAVGFGAAVPLLIAAWPGDPPPNFRIELTEFQKLHAEGAVHVFDVRNPEAYLDGHIEGALSMPSARST